jgi:hypothetical protein
MCQESVPQIMCIMGDEDVLKEFSEMYSAKDSVPQYLRKSVLLKNRRNIL